MRAGDVSLRSETSFGAVGDCIEPADPSSRCVSLKTLCYVSLATMAGRPTAEHCRRIFFGGRRDKRTDYRSSFGSCR
ncbi:unnamed protein product [Macrosiphum euphorbiae]|uniref:Uncharacterized protein n=1 Tax=Macrosiphum euphorbiae TaxID=13131 RepID=A0AAV0X9C9_9HEMI|nr:unnamed protein product [Macrosiphum euphorbiae]